MLDFSYFDQFQEINIDLTSYLKNLSVSGNYRFTDMQPVIVSIKNLFTHYQLVTEFKKNIDAILQYKINDGDTVEKISWDLYNTTDYWWIIYLFNNIKNPWIDWPFTQEQLNKLANLLYNEEGKYSYITYYKYLEEENNKKSNLILPREFAIRDFIWSYRQQLLGL